MAELSFELLGMFDPEIPVGMILAELDATGLESKSAEAIVAAVEWKFSKKQICPSVVLESIANEHLGKWKGTFEVPLAKYLPKEFADSDLYYTVTTVPVFMTYVFTPKTAALYWPTKGEVFAQIVSSDLMGELQSVVMDELNARNGK